MRLRFLLFIVLASPAFCGSTSAQVPTRADSLRGSLSPERTWWNVLRYDLAIAPNYEERRIAGVQKITFEVVDTVRLMQIDLQQPMQIAKASHEGQAIIWTSEGNAHFLEIPRGLMPGDTARVEIHFEGKPREARNPPWDGGWIWTRDRMGRPWMTVACQGIGASVWYPCKDHQSDKADHGASLSITVPDSLVAVANGRLMEVQEVDEGMRGYAWQVSNPISTYNLVPYIGHYSHWSEAFEGEGGALRLDYFVLDYEMDTARQHFSQVNRMLACFEEYFGPYPFYEDGYKLVQAPHLGMEHQSAIAYGNRFGNGYRGLDLSATGWGLKWDFIIVHESGHEWFGNSITASDIADLWVHEAFTSYSEVLYVACNYGEEAADEYAIGTRRSILNDRPIAGELHIHQKGSNDMYHKGSNMLHTIRQLPGADTLFLAMLHDMNRRYRHSVVSGREVEAYMQEFLGLDLEKVFDQYLRSADVPALEYSLYRDSLYYRWTNCVPDFDMPLRLKNGKWLEPKTHWQRKAWAIDEWAPLEIDPNFYVLHRQHISPPPGEASELDSSPKQRTPKDVRGEGRKSE